MRTGVVVVAWVGDRRIGGIPFVRKTLAFLAFFFLWLGKIQGNLYVDTDVLLNHFPTKSTFSFSPLPQSISRSRKEQQFLHNLTRWCFTRFLLPFACFFQFYFSSSLRRHSREIWSKLLHMVSTFPQSWSWGFQLLRLLYADLQNFLVWVYAEDKTVHLDGSASGSHSNQSPGLGHHSLPPASTSSSPTK